MFQAKNHFFSLAIFTFLSVFLLNLSEAQAGFCSKFFSAGKAKHVLSPLEVIELLKNPLHKKSDDFPVSITSHFQHEMTSNGMSLRMAEGISVKGFREVIYDYDTFQVEIIKPTLNSKRSETVLDLATEKNWVQTLSEKTKKYGKSGSTQFAVGNGEADLAIRILEQLNFVFRKYQTEKNWPPEFLQTLLHVAYQYADSSTYVIVREKTSGKIMGSIRLYSEERLKDLKQAGGKENDLYYFVESGNFAVTPDRDLPDEMKGLAATALYFHIARLIRTEAGANGRTTRIGTYASQGSSSDRFYQSLGFRLNVAESELENMYGPFDQYEKQAVQDTFSERVARSLRGLD